MPQNTELKRIEVKNKNIKTIIKNSSIKQTLINNLIQATQWKQDILNNNLNINSIAKETKKQNSYICRIYSLNFLAPDIKNKILIGNIPDDFNLDKVKRMSVPSDWEEQRKIFGFSIEN